MLTACYDLAYSPPTYDFVGFLLAAETERRKLKADSLEIRILPGPSNGFRKDGLPPQDVEVRRSMLQNIVVPMTKLLPSCECCIVQDSRADANGRLFGCGVVKHGMLQIVEAAKRNIYPFKVEPAKRTNYVTITLRESSYWPTRNSNLEEWARVGRHLRELGFLVVVIRDTDKAQEPFEDFVTSPRASTDLLYRASLYAGATLNLFVNNGPAWMCLFMGVPSAIFRITSPGAAPTSESFLARCGFSKSAEWPNLRPKQIVSWADDTFDEIIPRIEPLLQ